MQALWDERYQAADAEIVKKLAKRMCGRNGFLRDDIPELEQELAEHVAMNMHKFDPSRGTRQQFVMKVAKNRLLNLIEQKNAQKRGNRRNVLLSDAGEQAWIEDERPQNRIDLCIEVRDLVAKLPDELRQLAALRTQHSERELEGMLGLTRSQVRTRIQHLERIFREAGLAPDSD